ncbi:MAG TPA: GGDEF domain-containing protein [Novimethylophilus sp.]|jgi:diguanylate cyclase (GGDEF)-like protein|uniref:GGDEF domain-containing protein n=1 Tax=Novimethylophilus sp. TaxID=2137426 RepID=UPI002F3EC2BC
MLLDNRTLLFSLMLISGLMALSLAVVSHRREREGLRKWAGALALESVVWLLIAARGMIPDILSIVVANLLMATAQSLKLAAIYEYRQWAWPRWQCLLPILLSLLLFASLPYEDVRSRIGYGSLVYAVQLLMIIQVLRTDMESRTGRAWWLIFGSAVVMLPMLALRSIAALTGAYVFAAPHTSVAPNPVQLAVFVCVTALDLLGSLGFILMIKERADREIRALAMTDSLTGIFNRRAFMAHAEKDMAAAQRSRLPLALLMIDIDLFKRINDEHGHSAGDAVLVEVTALLSSQLRRQDTLGRYGGEEFCVLLPATDETGALALAEKLRRAVEAIPLSIGHGSIPVTISLGVTAWLPTACESCLVDCSRMLEDADKALYQAKRGGRNRTVTIPSHCPHTAPDQALALANR